MNNAIVSVEQPLITVVTPNYNYGEFLEACLDSILSQDYKNIQLVVIDGGSTDDSVDILKRFSRHIDYWHSAPDNGQADAINKGIARAQGELVNWINSDDQLAPAALQHIAECSLGNSDSLIAGSVLNRIPSQPGEDEIIAQQNLGVKTIVDGDSLFHQPGLWWRTDRLRILGGLLPDLHYCFDYLLLLRYLARWPSVVYSDQVLAYFTLHPASKTSTAQPDFDKERIAALQILLDDPALSPFHRKIKNRLRTHDWHQALAQISLQNDRTRISKAAEITLRSLLAPRLRINRYTAGAIKQLLA